MTPTLDHQFVHECAKKRNQLERNGSAEFTRMLTSFVVLTLVLLMLTFALIELKWQPGNNVAGAKQKPVQGIVEAWP